MKETATAIFIFLLLALAPAYVLGQSGELVIEGSGDSQAMLRDLSWQFMRAYSSVEVIIPESVGSTGGINALKRREIELARVSRPLTGEERNAGLTATVFARSPVVFVVHPEVSNIDNITSEQVKGIYSGKITMWDEIGGSEGFKIYPVGRDQGDSSREVLEDKLRGFKAIKQGNMVRTAFSAPDAIKMIKHHKNTIGYMPLTAAHRSGLRVLKFNGVDPSAENVKNGSYLLAVPLSVVSRKDISPAAKEFVEFLFSPAAQDMIRQYGGVPEKR